MVSQEFTEEPATSLLSQCLISGMYACPVPSEDLTFGLQRDGRNRNDSVQSDCVPSCSQPTGEEIFMPAGMVLQRGIKLPGMLSRCLMNCEVQKEIGHRHFSHEQGHGLSLTLGSHFPSDVFSSNHCEHNGLGAENQVCSGYVNAKGGSTKLCCQGVHKTLGNDHAVCEGETTTCANSLNPSSPTSHHMEAIARALWNSPYLQPAQQLLDEVVCVSNAVEPGSEKQLKRYVEMTMQNGVMSPLNQHEGNEQGNNYSLEEKHEAQTRIAKLFQLLDELENQSEKYFHQMDEVVSRFEVVAGTGAAASYTALTIQAMSKHFSNLRDAIVAQIHASRDALSRDLPRNHECSTRERSPDQNSRQKKETLQRLGMIQYRQMLRPPLRGLPENSVAVLRTWLFEHFLHPYPNDNEKLLLASQTGLTRNQISNWFINARVRLWKPMIEAMYREELAEESEPFCLN